MSAVRSRAMRRRTDAADRAAKDRTYELVREFAQRFRTRHNSISCREMLGCDVSTPEGMQRAKEDGLIAALCPTFVRSAAEILNELLPAEQLNDCDGFGGASAFA